MKEYIFEIENWQINQFFSPIRSKADVIILLMNSIKHMLIQSAKTRVENGVGMILVVAKTSRLFYFSENKCFSIAFPFLVSESDQGLTFTSKTVPQVDNKVTSDVLAVVLGEEFCEGRCALEFAEPIVDIAKDELAFWPFLLGLLMYEDGYIRYDRDEVNENGDLHPLHHYDCCYSSYSAYKIGLRSSINVSRFIDFMQLGTACHYLEGAGS